MSVSKKFKITIRQVKLDTHEMILDGEDIMSIFDASLNMVKQRNERSKLTGNVFSVNKIEEVNNE
jgi:hypothetical protein